MDRRVNVLDHGFVALRNVAGPTRRIDVVLDDGDTGFTYRPFDADDTDVANAARLSFEGHDADRTYEAEMKLTRYLLTHRHMTPFETIQVWLEMKLPIFVARQLVRQRTQSINEASARYIQLPNEWYVPEVFGAKPPPGGAKQGQVGAFKYQEEAKRRLQIACENAYADYEWALAEGMAPEHARLWLHVNHYTHWMTNMNLRNLLISFLSLRDDAHAQVEAQVYARATISLLEPHLPGIIALYKELIRS